LWSHIGEKELSITTKEGSDRFRLSGEQRLLIDKRQGLMKLSSLDLDGYGTAFTLSREMWGRG
jgi:hypothetical protein